MMIQEQENLLPVILTGKIVHGKALGRTVGMPTANIEVVDGKMLPECGVYDTRITTAGRRYPAVTNIGTRPSVDDKQHVTVEAHILDFHEDIYGEDVILEVLEFLRPIQKFGSLEEVQLQVAKDIEQVRASL